MGPMTDGDMWIVRDGSMVDGRGRGGDGWTGDELGLGLGWDWD